MNADLPNTLFSKKIFIYFFRWLCRNPDLVSLRCCQVKNNFTPNFLLIFFNCMIISWASSTFPSILLFNRALPCSAAVFIRNSNRKIFQSGAKSHIFHISKKDCLKDMLENCVLYPHPTDFAMIRTTAIYSKVLHPCSSLPRIFIV